MVIRLRSKRLALLFAEVWERLPEADRETLSGQIRLVLDDPLFLPEGNNSAALSVGVRKSIILVCLSRYRLQRQPDSRVIYVIAYTLVHLLYNPAGGSDNISDRKEARAMPKNNKPLSLYPLSFEEALKLILKAPPMPKEPKKKPAKKRTKAKKTS
jgi:hypothetical protein